jgi:hypothetical protein
MHYPVLWGLQNALKRKEHIYTRNLERSKRGNIEIERESEEKKRKRDKLWENLDR